MKFYALSHIGNSRNNQEDNLLINCFYRNLDSIRNCPEQLFQNNGEDSCNEKKGILLCVSDGMGGHASGEIASFLTVKYLAEHYANIVSGGKYELLEIIAELNREITRKSQESLNYKGMGSTLCGFCILKNTLYGFNVGDSRLYRFEKGNLTRLSKDHSEGQRLLDLNLLSEEEVKEFSKRKAIYKYIGMKTDLIADVFEIMPCEEGTQLLLCTDGLTDAVTDSEIQKILDGDMALKEKGERLLHTALGRNIGHGDNITIILTEF